MRRGVMGELLDAVKGVLRGGGRTATRSSRSTRRAPSRPSASRPSASRPSEGASTDVHDDQLDFEYSPCLDGDPDPGEVVWTWVPYEEDPTQGKDRPVAIVGRRGAHLLGVPLTSKQHDNELQVAVGTGSWDREGRPSYAKVERLLDVVPDQVRREGAVLSRAYYDAIVSGIRQARRR